MQTEKKKKKRESAREKQWFFVLVLNQLLLKRVRSARAKTYFGQRYATDGKTISPKPEQKRK